MEAHPAEDYKSREIRCSNQSVSDFDIGEFEPRPAVVAFGHGNGPAVGVGYRFDDCESEPGAAVIGRISAVEDGVSVVVWNSGPIVGDVEIEVPSAVAPTRTS